jgi:hypothetical protein
MTASQPAAPVWLLAMPSESISNACRANLQDWISQLTEFTASNWKTTDQNVAAQVETAYGQMKLMNTKLKSCDPPSRPTSMTPSHLVEIRQAFELEKETNLREPDECEIWIRKIRQAKADYVDHLEEHLKPDAEALLARTARKYFSNDVRQSFARQNLAVNTVAKLTEAMETMYSSKLSVFQYLKLVHEVKYTKSKGLQGYISELTEAQRRAFRHVERLNRQRAKVKIVDTEEPTTTATPVMKKEPGEPGTECSTCSCAVKAHEFSDLTAACLAYLKVTELHPNVALQLCNEIDDCRTAQDVYNRAKVLIDRFPKHLTSEDAAAYGAKSGNWTKKSGNQPEKKVSLEAQLKSIVDRLNSIEGEKQNAKTEGDPAKKKNNFKGKKGQKKETEARAAETSEADDVVLESSSHHFRQSV